MGGTSSKPNPYKLDLSNATLSVSDAQNQATFLAAKAAETASSGAWGVAKVIIIILVVLLVIGGAGTAIYYAFLAPKAETTLTIKSAKFGDKDVTTLLQGQVKGDSLYLAKGAADVSPGLTGSGSMIYQFSDETVENPAVTLKATDLIDLSLANRNASPEHFSNKKKSMPSGPTLWSRLSSFFVSGSGDQIPYAKDASSETVIPSGSAPLSAGSEGAYGIQYWMYIKDWNYNFGKEKNVLSRSDPTNVNIMSPNVTLHPTDNSLKVSVSVFPDTPGGSSKTEPAPAGHSGASDDVYVCEVPNVPLQTWVAVSITLFGRNLDVYLNGKLVKSCVLSGVPKPAIGDIHVNKEGGFSGYVCGLHHYPRMLTPSDASAFYGAGTSCTAATDKGVISKTTGYTVNFGIYDATGKQVSNYVF
jgi:hypothetical protein